ncbi:MAG: hypothetical protein COA97_02065 [Flavobacteriales bacterium]|nr:MAG: hypothetical protein COA97_02065 [Flavobacteriales bacterium]
MSDILSDIKESTKTFVDDRLKNPYITTVIAIWIFTNRVLVYGVFNFSDDKNFDEKIKWISQHLNKFEIAGYNIGFIGGVVYALIIGIGSMMFFNLATGFGKAMYKFINKTSIKMIRSVEPSKWINIKEFDKVYSENEELIQDNNVLKRDVDRLEGEIDSRNEKVNQHRLDVKKKDEEIFELTEITVENSKNVGRLESKIKKQESDITDKEQIIQNHIDQGKMNSEAIAKLEKELEESKFNSSSSNSRLYLHSGQKHKDIKEHYVVSTNTIFNARIILNEIGQTCTIYIGLKVNNKRYWIGFTAGKDKSTGIKGIEYNSTKIYETKEIIIQEYIMSLFFEAYPDVDPKSSIVIDCIRLRADDKNLSDIIFNYSFN